MAQSLHPDHAALTGWATHAEGPAARTATQQQLTTLVDDAMAFWTQHGPDDLPTSSGGFHGALLEAGLPSFPTVKGVNQHARHLWAFSQYSEARGKPANATKIAHDLYAWLMENAQLQSAKGVAFTRLVERGGGAVCAAELGGSTASKELLPDMYASKVTMMAAANYGRVFKRAKAKTLALSLFAMLKASEEDLDLDGLLELHAMVPENSDVAAEVAAVLESQMQTMQEAVGKPLAPDTNFGAQMVTVWTAGAAIAALEAAGAMSAGEAEAAHASVVEFGDFISAEAYDEANGGVFLKLVDGKAVERKQWWAEFEALYAFDYLGQQTGDSVYTDRFDGTLQFLDKWFVDKVNGDFYWEVPAAGGAPISSKSEIDSEEVWMAPGTKGHFWKATLHSTRALLRLTQGAGPSASMSG